MNLFIAEIIDANTATLRADEAWHCFKVLRYKETDTIHFIVNDGYLYTGTILVINAKQCLIKITSKLAKPKHNYYLHIAIAPTKQIDRLEWFIEKAVEIGIDEITFIRTKNSERTIIKLERLIKIVESAVKQSAQTYIPKINDLTPLEKLVTTRTEKTKHIAHCMDEKKEMLKNTFNSAIESIVLIGPEGDFTETEVELAHTNGFTSIELGSTRLRTETAGIYVCNAYSILASL